MALVTAVAALLAIPALLLSDPISYVPLLASTLLVAVSWAYLRVLRRSLSVSVSQMDESCERGQDARLSVALSNASVLPFPRVQMDFYVTDLFGGYDDVRTLTCALGSREETELGFDVAFTHLGTYHAGVSHVVIYDLIGLFSAALPVDARGAVTVRPRKVDLGAANPMRSLPDESTRALRPVAADDVDYSSVREYRYGDPLKTVHWNLSARSADGQMYTRVFETFTAPSLVIVIDPCSPDLDADDLMSLFDGMVEVAAALAAQAREDGVDAEVRYVRADGGRGYTDLATDDDADKMVSEMLRITPERGAGGLADAAEEMIDEAGAQSYGAGNLALVTSRTEAGLVAALVDAAGRRRNALAFVSVPRTLEGRARDRFLAPLRQWEDAGIAYGIVESNERMTEVVPR